MFRTKCFYTYNHVVILAVEYTTIYNIRNDSLVDEVYRRHTFLGTNTPDTPWRGHGDVAAKKNTIPMCTSGKRSPAAADRRIVLDVIFLCHGLPAPTDGPAAIRR